MVRIRKDKGGSGIGPYWWPGDDPVCEVPEELARDLLARPDEGWSLEPDPEPDPEGDGEGQGEEEPPAKAPARRSRAKGASA